MNLTTLSYSKHDLKDQMEQHIYSFVLSYSNECKLQISKKQLQEVIHHFYLHYFKEKMESSLNHPMTYRETTPLPHRVLSLMEMIFNLTQLIRRHEKRRVRFELDSPEEIYHYFYHLKFLNQETMKAIYLCDHELLETKDLSLGSHNQILITPKEVIAPAIKQDANQMILVHNHPSGETAPSEKDFEFTRKIDLLCAKLGIDLLDHVVIGNDFFSFKKEGFL